MDKCTCCKMYTNNFQRMLFVTFNVSRALGGCSIIFNKSTPTQISRFQLCPNTTKRVFWNFSFALCWNISAIVLAAKRYKNGNLDEFHLTLSWWLGFVLLLVIYSISRLFCKEIVTIGNAMTKLFASIQGKRFCYI